MHRKNICLTIALAVLAIAVWARVGYMQLGAKADPIHTNNTMLVADNREKLDICVDVLVTDVSTTDTRSLVDDAMLQVREHPLFAPAGLDVAEPEVTAGCPVAANLGAEHWDPKVGAAQFVDSPSPYRLFVFVANEKELEAAFGTRLPRTTAQEVFCQGHDCAEVTTALYVTPEELKDPAALVDALIHGVGLLPPSTGDGGGDTPPGSEK